jgi:hypothetical protein
LSFQPPDFSHEKANFNMMIQGGEAGDEDREES